MKFRQFFYIVLPLITGNYSYMMQKTTAQEFNQEVNQIIDKSTSSDQAITLIKALEDNLKYAPYFNSYSEIDKIWYKLYQRFHDALATIEGKWWSIKKPSEMYEGSYLGRLPSELRSETKKFGSVNEVVHEIKKIIKTQLPLRKFGSLGVSKDILFQLDRLKAKNEDAFKTLAVKNALMSFFKLFPVYIYQVQSLVQNLELSEEWQNEKALECDLIAAAVANNIAKVKDLIENKKVSPWATLLHNDYRPCNNIHYIEKCQFWDPICYVMQTNNNNTLINYLKQAQTEFIKTA